MNEYNMHRMAYPKKLVKKLDKLLEGMIIIIFKMIAYDHPDGQQLRPGYREDMTEYITERIYRIIKEKEIGIR